MKNIYLNGNFDFVSDQNTSTAVYKITSENNSKIIFCFVNGEEICTTHIRNYSSKILYNFEIFKKSFIEGSLLNLPTFIASALIIFENKIKI